MIATDHAPHAAEEKYGTMIGAAFGITGIETSFELIYTHFVKSGLVDIKTLTKWMATNPAEAFNVPAGKLAVGEPADIAIFDTEHLHTITADEFASKGKNTPFIGAEVYGTTVATFVDGKQVYGE
jgi:dihydroorotase